MLKKGSVMTFNVASEVGRLRRVIVHRPGLELSRLTPQNIAGLLFDDVMWAKLRRRVGQPDGQAGPAARDPSQPGHLRLPPDVRRPGLRAHIACT